MGQRIDNESGATMLEFSIVASVLVIFIFLGIDMLYLCYRAVSLQYTVSTVLREAVIGDPESAPVPYNHADAMEARLIDVAASFGIDIEADDIAICPVDNSLCTFNNDDTGNGQELLVVNIEFQTEVLFMNNYRIRATAIGRNEPF